MGARPDPGRQRDHQHDDERGGGELERDRQGPADRVGDRDPAEHRVAEVALHGAAQPAQVLHGDRRIEAEVGPQRGQLLGRPPVPEDDLGRVAR